MGKFLYVYDKKKGINSTLYDKITNKIFTVSVQPYRKSLDREYLYISNSRGITVKDFSFATGCLDPLKQPLEQDYFSFRLLSEANHLTLESDYTASRGIWYIDNEDYFLISSSQRILVAAMGDFKPNEKANAWMIASGCLGHYAWDLRIQRLKPAQQIIFNKSENTSHQKYQNILPPPVQLDEAFDEVFTQFNKEIKWGIALSGGVDSRASLIYLNDKNVHMNSYSWGLPTKTKDTLSDAAVASALAAKLSIRHSHININEFEENTYDQLLTYLKVGEGRVDHIQTFGGLDFWQQVMEDQIISIIRSDEAFGWLKSSSEKDVRVSMEMNLASDFPETELFFIVSGISQPTLPMEYERSAKESLEDWRDRLYRQWRIPNVLSGLSDPALLFCEITCPLLHPIFLSWSKAQKSKDLTNKRKYKKHIDQFYQDIPYAKKASVSNLEYLLKKPELNNLLINFIGSTEFKEWLGIETQSLILDKLNSRKSIISEENDFIRNFKGALPYWMKKLLRRNLVPYRLAWERISLRLFIVFEMNRLLKNDGKA